MNPASANQMSPDQLLQILNKDLTQLIQTDVDADLLPEKQRQIFRLDKANKYNRGLTYIAPDVNKSTGVVTWAGVSVGTSSEKDLEAASLYDYNVDMVKGYGRKFFSVLGTRPFYNMKGKPEDPQSENDRSAARMAELAAQLLRSKWQIRIRNIEMFAKQWEAGNVYAYLNHAADEKLWGTYDEPQYEPKTVEIEPQGYRCPNCAAKFDQPTVTDAVDPMGAPTQQEQCPQCGAPVSDIHFEESQTAEVPEFTGSATYPHAGPKLTLTTGFTTTVPFDASGDFDEVPMLLYEYEAHKGALLQYFEEDLRKHLDENNELRQSGEMGSIHAQGAMVRGAAASLRGVRTVEKKRWTFSRYWLATSMYELVQDKDKRAMLYESFPDGLKVSQVEGVIIRLENEALADHWALFTPEPGEYIYRDPMCWGILPLQDIKNDIWNLLIATIERGMPSHVMDPEVIDEERLREGKSLEILWAKPGAGRRLEDAFATIPSAKFPDGAMGLTEGAEQVAQQYTGLLPAAWGGQSGNKTAEQARADLNQALMQLSVPGEFASAGWVDTFTKAIKLWAKHGEKSMNVEGELLDFEVLRSGRWYFEGDPGVPMSWSEIQQRLDLLIGQSPQVAHAVGLDLPINSGVMRDYLVPGLAELRVPGEDERDKILDRIREMLSQQPVFDGQQYQPSIMPDPDLDDPMTDGDLLKQWLNGPQGRKEQQRNPQGYANVKLHLAALKQMGMIQQMQQGSPPPDGGPNQPPPGDNQQAPSPPPPPPTEPVGNQPAQ